MTLQHLLDRVVQLDKRHTITIDGQPVLNIEVQNELFNINLLTTLPLEAAISVGNEPGYTGEEHG